MTPEPYSVELHLKRSREASTREGKFDLMLVDCGRSGTFAHSAGTAFLDLRSQTIPRLGMTVNDFLTAFLRGDPGAETDGLLFGQHLLDRLLADAEVRALWDEIQARRSVRPLRLELLLPRDDAGVVTDIPFELLADAQGFLFYRYGWSLVRVIAGLEPRTVSLAPEDTLLVAWANPAVEPLLPESLFKAHEVGTEAPAAQGVLTLKPPCRHATLTKLEESLMSGGRTTVVSLVAHGSERGGAVWLHKEGGEGYPSDDGHPVGAAELAAAFKRGRVDAALLWVCHGGKHGAVSGSLAAALLDPDRGDLAAVVTAHAAIRADGTATVLERTLRALRSERDLGRAVNVGRMALTSTDLQWAAPVFYARPVEGRDVTVESVVDSVRAPASTAPGTVEYAPKLASYFRGREDVMRQGLAMLDGARLVSVTGMGGIGKSEVANAIARQAAMDARFGLSRAVWLSLDGLRSAEDVRGVLAVAFGAEPAACPNDMALARHVGGGRALVVLDNAEDAIRGNRGATRELVRTLLRICPSLRLLLATREALGDLGEEREEVLPLVKLSPGAAREVFSLVAGDRLSEAEKGTQAFEDILGWLDGHPQSIVLVARQVGTMSMDTLWGRLRAKGAEAVQIAGLEGESPDAKGDALLRRDRLVSSLNLSFRPLYENQALRGAAEMFLWLGHLPAGLPGVLVPVVFGEQGEEHRATLLRRCMAEEADRERRLVLPVPVRDYARARAVALLSPERKLELVTASFRGLALWLEHLHARAGQPGAREVLDRGVRESANWRALLDVVAEIGMPEAGSAPCRALAEPMARAFWFWSGIMSLAGRAQAAAAIGEQVRVRLVGALVPTSLAQVAEALGDLFVRTDRLKEAEEAYEHALPIYKAIDARLGEANTLRALGDLFVRTARLKEAEEAYGHALPIYKAIDDRLGEANTLHALGDLFVRTARLKEAEEAYGHALPMYKAIDDRLGEANTRKALGDLFVRTDRLKEAEEAYEHALPIYKAIDARLGEANTRKALGDLFVRTDRLKEAEEAYEHALPIYKAIDARLGEANTLRALGDLFVRTARLKEAEEAYEHALPIYKAIDARLGEANTLRALGDLFVRTARLKEAEEAYEHALPIYKAIDARLGEANTRKALGDLFVRTARLKEAEEAYEHALPIYKAIDARLGEANTRKALGDLFVRTARLKEAEEAYGHALPLYKAVDDRLGEANTRAGLGNLALVRREYAAAFLHQCEALALQRRIDNQLGIAATHAYLARVALAAGYLIRAAALLQPAINYFTLTDDHFDLLLALNDLARAYGALNREEAAFAALLLAWHNAAVIGHPFAEQMSQATNEPGPPSGDALAEAERIVHEALAGSQAELERQGIDPYAPLEIP
ncbi:tetratricopeptide repeat protein [Polyangium aurulentum]|uniref:tetratricopeptide repeat protein n=1 Tax=Polyangium aurulentum TaxID=2567896 RepID=UPI0023E01CF4|nr:tetratricopeptide repeat protein [Polyangium aurulentum]UQA61082.1 tetratricopeptide repeat protein [Polyangium aurulentum]